MKKVASILIVICLIIGVISIVPVSVGAVGADFISSGESLISGDYKYEILNSNSVKITGYVGTETTLTIPSKIEDKTVTSIGDFAFFSCHKLTNVTIPSGITSVGDSAFNYCTGLISITIGNSVTTIGDYAFLSCSKLTSVKMSDSVTNIGDKVFSSCSSLTSITIPNSITSIGKDAFEYCENLASIDVSSSNKKYCSIDGVLFNKDKTVLIIYPNGKKSFEYSIPTSVTNIGDSAFKNCNSLSCITIPDSVTSIGKYAFEYCSNITGIALPNSVITIGNYAFENCSHLISVTIPNSVTSIGKYVFGYCEKLTSIDVSNSNKKYSSVDGVLFDKDKKLLIRYPIGKKSDNYTIPNKVTGIGDHAFSDCIGLTKITIPDSVITIGNEAFVFCENLTKIIMGNSVKCIAESAFSDCSKLISVRIPNSVTTIGSFAFFNCVGLTSISIPNSVNSIGDNALGYYGDYFEVKVENYFTIKGYTGSTAEKYAKDNGFKFVSLGESAKPAVKKTIVTLAKTSVNIYVKGTTTIKATIKNSKGKTTYKSSNSKVAKVNKKGVVTGVKAGTAKITVTNNGVKKVFTATVKNPKLNKTSITINKGKTFTLEIIGKVGEATFKSSNKKIATVNAKGKITAKKRGNTTINVKTNGVTLKCKVKVN